MAYLKLLKTIKLFKKEELHIIYNNNETNKPFPFTRV